MHDNYDPEIDKYINAQRRNFKVSLRGKDWGNFAYKVFEHIGGPMSL